ncbi:hypothetical protein [Macrococcoides caseolyticum]|uniref:hypothetical protein n=1 Tax=Macrococcoides caseolyticum TaxID=69966 RepID=UPI001642C874|nr:hypothetical protein [Macrococcus caseolyticus]
MYIYEKVKAYFFRNKIVLLLFLLLILILTGINFWFNHILNDISVILAIPSFLISFFVLNSLNITKYDLEDFYTKRKLKDAHHEEMKNEFVNYNNEHINVIKNSINDYEKYLRQIKASRKCNQQLINKCKNYLDLIEFYKKTIKFIKSEHLEKFKNTSFIDELDKEKYKDIYINDNELEELNHKLEKLNDIYFTDNQLEESKKEDLIFLFDSENGLFKKYYNINKLVFKESGGIVDEES